MGSLRFGGSGATAAADSEGADGVIGGRGRREDEGRLCGSSSSSCTLTSIPRSRSTFSALRARSRQ